MALLHLRLTSWHLRLNNLLCGDARIGNNQEKKPRTNRNNTLYSSQSGVVASDLFFLLNLYQNWVFLPSFKMFNEPSPTDIFWPYKPQKVVPELLQNLHIAVSFRFQRFAPVNQRGLLKAVLKVKWLKLVRPSVLGSCIIRPAIFPSTRLSNVFPSHSATGRLATRCQIVRQRFVFVWQPIWCGRKNRFALPFYATPSGYGEKLSRFAT